MRLEHMAGLFPVKNVICTGNKAAVIIQQVSEIDNYHKEILMEWDACERQSEVRWSRHILHAIFKDKSLFNPL